MRSSPQECCHCGTTETPCWRKGPPEKPVLCNACGARFLVKRDLAGYFPGTRKGGSIVVARHHEEAVKAKAPRARPLKRKAEEEADTSFEAHARRVYEEYRVLQELGMAALLFRTPQQPFSLQHHMPAIDEATSASTSSGEGGSGALLGEDSFRRDSSHYLDASSEDCQEHPHDVSPEVGCPASSSERRCEPIHRRPRKQSRPSACSC